MHLLLELRKGIQRLSEDFILQECVSPKPFMSVYCIFNLRVIGTTDNDR